MSKPPQQAASRRPGGYPESLVAVCGFDRRIKPIPDLPAGLREAATRGTLIPFVGAGASRIAGCPTWVEFANAALRSLVTLGNFSHAQLDQIRGLSPRIQISIALTLAKENSVELNFEKILYPLGARESQKGQRLCAALSKLGKRFVTTNYDEWLDKAIYTPAPSIVSVSDLCRSFPGDG